MAKMGRPPKGAKAPVKKMLSCWKAAWEATDGTAPYGMAIEKLLNKSDMSIYDIKTEIGIILAKSKEEVTKDDLELVAYSERLRYLREQALAEKVALGPAGQIFLLKSQYGYKDQAVDITLKPVSLVPEFGAE
jgi:hypothetical protein